MSRRRRQLQPVPFWVMFAQAGLTILVAAGVVVFVLTLIPEALRLFAPLLLAL